MENKHSTKVVRLLRREPAATRIAAPKRKSNVPELAVDLARVKYSESKHVTRVMLASSVGEKKAHTSELDETFYKKEQQFEYGLAFASGVMPKLASVFLIPMILIYPLYPAYAAEESITQSASSTETTSPSSGDALQSVKNDSNAEPQTTGDKGAAPSLLIPSDAPSTSATPSTSDADVFARGATSTTESATETPPPPPDSEVGGGPGLPAEHARDWRRRRPVLTVERHPPAQPTRTERLPSARPQPPARPRGTHRAATHRG